MALCLQPRRVVVDGSTNLVQDVLQLGRLRESSRSLVVAGAMPGQLMCGHVDNCPTAAQMHFVLRVASPIGASSAVSFLPCNEQSPVC